MALGKVEEWATMLVIETSQKPIGPLNGNTLVDDSNLHSERAASIIIRAMKFFALNMINCLFLISISVHKKACLLNKN